MTRTKPFQISALSPTPTALLVASVNTILANYLHPGSNKDNREFFERFAGRMRKYPITGANDFVGGEYGCLFNSCGVNR